MSSMSEVWVAQVEAMAYEWEVAGVYATLTAAQAAYPKVSNWETKGDTTSGSSLHPRRNREPVRRGVSITRYDVEGEP